MRGKEPPGPARTELGTSQKAIVVDVNSSRRRRARAENYVPMRRNYSAAARCILEFNPVRISPSILRCEKGRVLAGVPSIGCAIRSSESGAFRMPADIFARDRRFEMNCTCNGQLVAFSKPYSIKIGHLELTLRGIDVGGTNWILCTVVLVAVLVAHLNENPCTDTAILGDRMRV